ncbi:MAG: BamA/TamA family outer membrane protein [Vicinamibacterales bacterium]
MESQPRVRRFADAVINMRRAVALTALLTAAVFLFPSLASAQYFGQNKVRHSDMSFQVLTTEHFDIHFYDEKRDAAFEAGRMAERWHARLAPVFGGPLSSRQTIVLYASHPDFRGTTVVPDEIGETTGGLTEGIRRRIVMPLAGPLADTDHVLGHELVHAFQFDVIERLRKQDIGVRAAFSLPLWFVEGMAEYLSVGPVGAHTAVWLRDGVSRDALPHIAQLDDPSYFPYRWGHAFWAHVAGKHGDTVIQPLLVAAATSGDPVAALETVLGIEAERLSAEWHTGLKRTYGADGNRDSSPAMRPLLGGAGKSRLNVGPAISPDGSKVAFYSERDGLAVDLFVADAATGAIARKLTELAIDRHTDSLQFVNAAGAWSPDSRSLAYVGISQGRPQLSVANVETGQVDRRYSLSMLGDVFSASWSPDRRSIVMAAMSGGYMDLFLLDTESGDVTRLTNDSYTELQPAWSPDGRHIAYVTDRFTTNLQALRFGDLRLAWMDPRTRQVHEVGAFDTGKHLNPQWSRDGQSILFIADHDGVPNVYQIGLADRRIERLTSVSTGITGIAANSPALTVAATGRAIVTLHEAGGYQLYAFNHMQTTAAVVRPAAPADVFAGLSEGQVSSVVGSRGPTVFDRQGFNVRPYRPRLGLESIAPLQAGVGAGQLGPFVSGGTAATFADILGHHRVTLGLQGSSYFGGGRGLADLSLLGGYQNERRRWSWGITGGQFTYPSLASGSALGLYNGEPALIEQEITTREVTREVTGLFTRNLSRARRLEFAAGYENLSFDARARFTATSVFDGVRLTDERIDLPAPRGLHLATAHAAFVHDTSVFGGTSPVMGERYRVQAGVSSGSASVFTVLADYRRYVPLAGPLSLAGRAMHYGRYGADAEDLRMGELFIGYPHLLRGYDSDSIAAGCALDAGTTCTAAERLVGSRVAVANLELRTAISGYRGLVSGLLVPVEAALFVDAGLPWSSRSVETARSRSRSVLSSVGATLRVNFFGSAVGQLSYVRAVSGPTPGWRWQFALAPGF